MVVLDTGLASKGTIVPLSNSPDIVFITVTIAKRKNPNPPRLELITKSGLGSIGLPEMALCIWPLARVRVVRAKAMISIA